MRANLHLHSRFSDGSLWPEEIAAHAARQGLELSAVTDHDTMGGAARYLEACGRLGIKGMVACEIDVSEPEINYKSELLGYFPNAASPPKATRDLLGRILQQRRKRLDYFLYWARTIFRRDDLVFEDILADKLGGLPREAAGPELVNSISWSKVDLFLYLKTRGLVSPTATYKSFKREWFVPGRFPKYKMDKPSVLECARAIRADGGYAVIPHVGHLWNDDIDAMEAEAGRFSSLLDFFSARGVEGVELYWYSGKKRSSAINEFVERQARNHGMFLTYGSDCHGPGTDKYTLDKFEGDFMGFPRWADMPESRIGGH